MRAGLARIHSVPQRNCALNILEFRDRDLSGDRDTDAAQHPAAAAADASSGPASWGPTVQRVVGAASVRAVDLTAEAAGSAASL